MKINSNKKGQLSLIIINIIFIAIFTLCLVINWDHAFWEGIQFEIRDGSVVEDIFKPLGSLIEYSFSSKDNILFSFGLPSLFSVLLIILLFVFCNEKCIASYSSLLFFIFGWSVFATIVLQIIIFNGSNSFMMILFHIAHSLVFMSFVPFILVIVKKCEKCGYFNTKKCISKSSSEYYYPKHVEGGYKTVKADVKDRSGNVVGTVEAKTYQEGYTYTASSTTTTKIYKCINCGEVTETESES